MDSENRFKKEQVVIFDLCGTLYDSNTTFEFLDRYVHPINKYYRVVRKITRFKAWRVLNKILFKLSSFDLTRYLALKSLRNFELSWLKDKTHTFFNEVLINKRIDEVHYLLNEAQKAASKIILISASLDFIVAEAAAVLNINNFYASSLGYHNNTCTGFLTKDLLGKKEQVCTTDNIQLEKAIVITDNLSDLGLVKKSAAAYIVTNKKNRSFWNGLKNINMIYV